MWTIYEIRNGKLEPLVTAKDLNLVKDIYTKLKTKGRKVVLKED